MIAVDRAPVVVAAIVHHARVAAKPSIRLERDPNVEARAILADPEFRHPPHPVAKASETTVWDRFARRVGDAFANVLRAIFHRSVAGETAGSTVGLIGLIVAGLVMAFVIARIARRAVSGGEGAEDVALQRAFDDEALFADAEAAAKRGDFERASAFAFGAAIRRLDRAGIVAFDPSRTPGEYRRAVRRVRSSLDEPFGVVARAFVLAVYGRRPPDATSWAQVRAAYADLANVIA